MKKILLVADAGGEIGWGHAMRTLAVAEELAQRSNVQAIWVTETPDAVRSLNPPLSVDSGGQESLENRARTGRHSALVDLPKLIRLPLDEKRCWYMIDHGIGFVDTNRICPHFGAEERDWGPGAVVCGPRWMPLRAGYNYRRTVTEGTPSVLVYRGGDRLRKEISEAGLTLSLPHLDATEDWAKRRWSCAVVPASTIAYECMAMKIPVLLLSEPNDELAKTMVAAGAALNYSQDALRVMVEPRRKVLTADIARDHVDGGGAERVADLLERW